MLIFILLLINRRDLMGDHVNGWLFNVVAWGSSIIMIILTLVLVYVAIFEPSAAGLSGSLAHPHADPWHAFAMLWQRAHHALSVI